MQNCGKGASAACSTVVVFLVLTPLRTQPRIELASSGKHKQHAVDGSQPTAEERGDNIITLSLSRESIYIYI